MNKANPAVIGGFVIGAIALIVVGILAFGGSNWFREQDRYVAFFPGSVKGLQVGAPVSFRGVTIGQVVDVLVAFDDEQLEFKLPVVFEIDPTKVQEIGQTDQVVEDDDDFQQLIEAGLRAQLEVQSLLTGLLLVNLDMRPDTDVNLVDTTLPYEQVPTVASGLEKIQQSAGQIANRLPSIIDELSVILKRIDEDLGASSGDIQQILQNVAELTSRLQERGPAVGKIIENAEAATTDVRQAARTLDQVLQMNSDAIGSLIDEWTLTAASVRRMSDQINETIAENREGLRDFTETGLYEYTGLAQDAQRMVDQITRVTEELERDPARFLFGDRTGQGVVAE